MSSRRKRSRAKTTGARRAPQRPPAAAAKAAAARPRSPGTGESTLLTAALPWLSLALRLALGAILVYAAVPKLLHPDQFAEVITNYRIISGMLASLLALTLPWLELVTGALLIAGVFIRVAALLSTAMFGVFTVALLSAQVRNLDINCGCFNVTAGSGDTTRSLVEAVLLLVAAVVLVFIAKRSERYGLARFVHVPPARRRLALTAALVTLAALLAAAMAVAAARDTGASSAPSPEPAAAVGTGQPSPAGSGPATSLEPGTLAVIAGRELTSSDQLAAIAQALPSQKLNVSQTVAAQGILDLLAAGTYADVVQCRLDQLPWLVAQGHLEPLDTSRLSAWSQLSQEFLSLPGLTVDGQTYGAPVNATVTGLIYREDRVETAPTSYRDLFAQQFKDKAAIEDDVASAVRLAAAINGWADTADLSPEQLSAVGEVLKTDWPHFATHYSDQTELEQLFESGKVIIATGTAATAERLQAKGVPVAFVAPKEGLLVRGNALAVGAATKNVGPAYSLLDYYLSLPAQQLDAQSFGNVPSRADAGVTLAKATGGAKPILVTPPTDLAAWQNAWEGATTEPSPGGG